MYSNYVFKIKFPFDSSVNETDIFFVNTSVPQVRPYFVNKPVLLQEMFIMINYIIDSVRFAVGTIFIQTLTWNMQM